MAHGTCARLLSRALSICIITLASGFSQPFIQCLDYSPYRAGQKPGSRFLPTYNEIADDVALLKRYTGEIRSYGLEGYLDRLPQICDSLDMGLHYGVWLVANDQVANDAAVDKLIAILSQGHPCIRSVVIGTESIYRGDITVQQLIEYIHQVKAVTSAPVSAAETFYQYLAMPELTEAVDYILYHCYPFWEGISLQAAPQYIIDAFTQLKNRYPGKELILGETGWPSAGAIYRDNLPNEDNQFAFFSNYLLLAHENGCKYMLFEAFDEPWKSSEEPDFAAHWGFFDTDRNPKPLLNRLKDYSATTATQLPHIRPHFSRKGSPIEPGNRIHVYDAIGRTVGQFTGESPAAGKTASGTYLQTDRKRSVLR